MKQNKTITINQVADEIVSMIFENGSFMSATIKFKEPCFLLDSLCDLRIRPIELKDSCGWQFKYGSKCINYAAGDFRYPEELIYVPGIGEGILEELLSRITTAVLEEKAQFLYLEAKNSLIEK